jgi:hypothetical protein
MVGHLWGAQAVGRRWGASVASLDVCAAVGAPAIASHDWLAHHARVRPSKVAVTDLGTGRRITYADGTSSA